jgi:hypothetical protein
LTAVAQSGDDNALDLDLAVGPPDLGNNANDQAVACGDNGAGFLGAFRIANYLSFSAAAVNTSTAFGITRVSLIALMSRSRDRIAEGSSRAPAKNQIHNEGQMPAGSSSN